jgi:CheY-like chemotaxis protein
MMQPGSALGARRGEAAQPPPLAHPGQTSPRPPTGTNFSSSCTSDLPIYIGMGKTILQFVPKGHRAGQVRTSPEPISTRPPVSALPPAWSKRDELLDAEKIMVFPMLSPDAVPAPGSETILLVEDDESIRSLIRDGLQEKGFKVLQGDGGEEALDIVQNFKGQIDLLVTDVVMPQMSGIELADIIKGWRPNTKVLLISGYATLSSSGGKELDHQLPFLQKPFTQEELNVKIREVLDSKPEWAKRAA